MLKKLLSHNNSLHLAKIYCRGFASANKFIKFDYTDGLNSKTLLTEEEIMV